jgi:glutamine synthetase
MYSNDLYFIYRLLKALELVDKAATAVCKYFDRDVTKVNASLGCEQEYFVIDKALYYARPDLVMGGRTVFGHNPARGQQLDDHYFGSIPPRIYNFMKDFEIECHKLGIPVSTRHNEVAPGQFEVAPLFEELNVANDHNQLMMDIMQKVAERHSLRVLFHEKPFAGLNGTGKHNNWSLITNGGVNLFQPSSSARENLQFLVFFVNTIKAVFEYADLLRASVATAGNDYRLGANEAPPAIMSAFIGSQLSAVLDELEHSGNIKIRKGDNMYLKFGIEKIPEILLDNTDRNRTSPFAFTGNKFEFRAVGGEANVAAPMTILNLIVSEQLRQFKKDVDARISKGSEKRLAIVNVLRDYVKSSGKVRFEGDNYSESWVKEAEKRGLSNITNTPRALKSYLDKKNKDLFIKTGILSERELEARNETMLENYIMANGLKGIGIDGSAVIRTITEISKHIEGIKIGVNEMIDERRRINKIDDAYEKAIEYCDNIKEKYFERIRYHVDKLELYVDDDDWPLVKYRELLFVR